ncbi:MAG: hypothetical protein V1913_17960 [Fibrobacterota bacterium]
MKKTLLFIVLALACLAPDLSAAEKNQIARVEAPFIPVLRERKPQAEMIMQARRGERFQVRQVGEYWVQVYVPPNNEIGWIELGMETPNVTILDEDSSFFVWQTGLMVLGSTLLLVAFFLLVRRMADLRRKKALESLGGK